MKKLIFSASLLIGSLLSLNSFAFKSCDTSSSNFCNCFIRGCESTFPAGECNYNYLSRYFNKVGIVNAFKAHAQGNSLEECEDGIRAFIKNCH